MTEAVGIERPGRMTVGSRLGAGLSEIHLYGVLFGGAVGAFCLARLADGPAADVLAIAGNTTCGWSWLLVRALFRTPTARRPVWPLALVLTLAAIGAFLRLSGHGAAAMPRMIDNLGTLVSSSLLLLAAIEPLKGVARATPRAERRFRIGFAASYAAVLAIAVIWVDGAPADSLAARWGLSIKSACAVLALLGMGFAVWYRRRHPLPEAGRPRRRLQTLPDDGLGERLLRAVADETVYTRHDLKVADVARRLGEAEYKVTQSITGGLGFRNFNHMANHFRVEAAKRKLGDARFDHLPVLTIAFDCGFGSIGPFNRAFKAETGETPMAFRQAARKHGAVRARSGVDSPP